MLDRSITRLVSGRMSTTDVTIRDATADDLEVLYDICLRTGRSGDDASELYRDHALLGSIYVGPYVALPEEASRARGFVAADGDGVGGYVLGTLDTRTFEAACERAWWPALRARHPDPGPSPRTPDEALIAKLHRPDTSPDEVVEQYPAHLHIDLYPRLQGRGIGRRMIERLLAWMIAAGTPGVHLGVGPTNARAIAFYERCGFARLAAGDPDDYWMVKSLV